MVRYRLKLKKLKKLDTQSHWHKAHITLLPLLPLLATHILTNYNFILETLQSIKRLYIKELLLVIQQAARLENIVF